MIPWRGLPMNEPRRFRLVRDVDVTGVTGTGTVAHGVQWPDGAVTVRWVSRRASTVQWDCLEDAVAVHGHGGQTRIEWHDESSQPTALVVPDSPKMIRETLCVSQACIGNSPFDASRRDGHLSRLGRLIAECDRHRPLGPDGKHGDRHTATCGCEDKGDARG